VAVIAEEGGPEEARELVEHYLQGPGGEPPLYALSYGLEEKTDQ